MATMIEDFNGNSLNRDNWPVLYGGDANGYSWSHDDVHVGNGVLTVSMTNHGGAWTAGGLSQGWSGETYGHYEIRARVDAGQGTGAGIILWPTSNAWPPEIDLLETPDGDRSTVYFSKHWDGGGGSDWYETEGYAVDATKWHTYTLDWQPGKLTYSIDGHERYSTTENVPDQAMSLAFMGYVAKPGEHWYGGGPDGSTPGKVNLEVDYVHITDGSGTAPAASQPEQVIQATHASEPDIAATWQAEAAASASAEVAPHHDVAEVIDWNAWAEQLQANYAATGQWWV